VPPTEAARPRATARHVPLTAEEAAVRVRGIAFIVLAVFCFGLLDAMAKFAATAVPSLEVAWFRYSVNLVIAIAVLQPWRHWSAYLTRRPWLQVWRGLFLLGATVLNFFALRSLPLAVTGSILFAGPLLATALAGPILGEWPGPRRWAAVVVGFIGVIIVIQPDPASFNPAALLSVGAAFSTAAYSLSTRVLAATDSAAGMLIYAAALATILLTPAMPPIAVAPPTWQIAAALVGTGIAGGLGHWFLIAAHRDAPPTVLAPFNYTQLIWMILLGYLVFGDVPGPSTLIGAGLIVASGLYALYRERVRRDR
jgi:drug/metabolite transporter (DMT)-like permease